MGCVRKRARGLRPEATQSRYVGRNRGEQSYLIPALDIIGFDILVNLVNRPFSNDYHSNFSTIRRNLHSSWVVDSDPFKTNQLGHPYQGSMYHAFARSAGLNYWESLGYTFVGSAAWEIAGENTPPSRNDQSPADRRKLSR